MFSWWYSLRVIKILVNFAIWSIAVLGIVAVILGKRQTTLQDQEQVAEKVRTKKAIAEAQQEIIELQPKPLKNRILAYLNALNPQILELAKTMGQREFQISTMTDAQVADLQRLCAEDSNGQFIAWIPGTFTLTNLGDGKGTKRGQIKFSITDELLE